MILKIIKCIQKLLKKAFSLWWLLLLFLFAFVLYALLHFQFQPGEKWRLVIPEETSPLPPPPSQQKGKSFSFPKKLPTPTNFRIQIQGSLVQVVEFTQKKGKDWKSSPKYFTVEEWKKWLESNPKSKNSYFRLYLTGEERYGIYLKVREALKAFVAPKRFQEIWRF